MKLLKFIWLFFIFTLLIHVKGEVFFSTIFTFEIMQDVNINSLPKDKILDCSKLKAFADNKLNVNEKPNFGLGKTENILGKGENAGSFSHNVFKGFRSRGC